MREAQREAGGREEEEEEEEAKKTWSEDKERVGQQTGRVRYTEKVAWYDPRVLLGMVMGLGPRWRVEKEVVLGNAREERMDLDLNGFELTSVPEVVTDGEDWTDPGPTSRTLFPAAERAIERRYPGATAKVFDHIVRGPDRSKPLTSGPVQFVHGDYSVTSGGPRIAALLRESGSDPEILEAVMEDRVAIVNVWCPLKPVERDPLGCIDFATTDPSDVATVRVVYTERTGHSCVAYYNPEHRWYTYPDMQPGEAVLLKTWDSQPKPHDNPRRSRFALHSAVELVENPLVGLRENASSYLFSLFSSPPPTTPRVSVEIRAMVLFSKQAPELFRSTPFVAPHIKRLDQPGGADGFEKRLSVTVTDGDPDGWQRSQHQLDLAQGG